MGCKWEVLEARTAEREHGAVAVAVLAAAAATTAAAAALVPVGAADRGRSSKW